ncbi:hypothetical protein HELRODRAFT_193531 [Helobdella robusta]|uniref:Uncharacterized protein n=1 Tax=Helobdella robusta TaxID=6412 RepID=T1FV34_HELRO|nr:hypothetical protein HELRODRAFT_193531 [Helobdella robusta]ESN95529.1 hypothetical protein HELRODRAFT_193531 [Helobdella robusta]
MTVMTSCHHPYSVVAQRSSHFTSDARTRNPMPYTGRGRPSMESTESLITGWNEHAAFLYCQQRKRYLGSYTVTDSKSGNCRKFDCLRRDKTLDSCKSKIIPSSNQTIAIWCYFSYKHEFADMVKTIKITQVNNGTINLTLVVGRIKKFKLQRLKNLNFDCEELSIVGDPQASKFNLLDSIFLGVYYVPSNSKDVSIRYVNSCYNNRDFSIIGFTYWKSEPQDFKFARIQTKDYATIGISLGSTLLFLFLSMIGIFRRIFSKRREKISTAETSAPFSSNASAPIGSLELSADSKSFFTINITEDEDLWDLHLEMNF